MKGDNQEAKNVLSKIIPADQLDNEVSIIEKSIKSEISNEKVSFKSKSVLIVVLIGAVLSGLQQFTGINAVLYYGADIFEKALGYGEEDVLKQQVLLAFVNLIFTFIAMFTVDKLGRKPLIYIGCLGMAFGFILLSLTLMQQNLGVLSLLGVLIFVGSFALSMGPVVWVILSEMFPNKIRSVAMSVAVAVQWGSNFLVSQSFPVVTESNLNQGEFWNGSLPYFIFIGFIVIIAGFTYQFIPETKGKSL